MFGNSRVTLGFEAELSGCLGRGIPRSAIRAGVAAAFLMSLSGCAFGRAPLTNVEIAAAPLDLQAMAADAIIQLNRLYPPGGSRIGIDESGAFGKLLEEGMRRHGYAVVGMRRGAPIDPIALPLRYVVDQPLPGMYRVTLHVGLQTISRGYRAAGAKIVPTAMWSLDLTGADAELVARAKRPPWLSYPDFDTGPDAGRFRDVVQAVGTDRPFNDAAVAREPIKNVNRNASFRPEQAPDSKLATYPLAPESTAASSEAVKNMPPNVTFSGSESMTLDEYKLSETDAYKRQDISHKARLTWSGEIEPIAKALGAIFNVYIDQRATTIIVRSKLGNVQ